MVSKNDVKYIQSLCNKKQRQQEGLFIVEGPKIMTELLASNYTIKNIYATKNWLNIQKTIKSPITEVTTDELDKLSSLQTPQEVLAIVEQKTNTLPNLPMGMHLLLDGIQDPGNLGTIIRIADWFGIKNIICTEDTADLYGNKVIQSSMGSFTRVNVWYGDVTEVLLAYKKPVFGAVLNGSDLYKQTKVKNAILVIGNEGKGVRSSVSPFITNAITIPRVGAAESLNAAVATGIILSHLI